MCFSEDIFLNEYEAVVSEVDSAAAKLFELHGNHIVCGRGCSECCSELYLLPVELFSIAVEMKRNGFKIPGKNILSECVYLAEGVCRIYEYRPVICRIHGLPIEYEIKEYGPDGEPVESDSVETDIRFCDLNFSSLDKGGRKAYFTPPNTYSAEQVFRRLTDLNRKFMETAGAEFRGREAELPFSGFDLDRARPL